MASTPFASSNALPPEGAVRQRRFRVSDWDGDVSLRGVLA